MRDRGAEADDAAVDEDRREDEHVGDVLAALERVVVDQEVAFLERLDRMAPEAGAQGLADRAQLHRDQLGLRHGVAVAVHQAGRAVARLAQDGRVGRADQLHAHLAGAGDQRLADDGVVDRAQRSSCRSPQDQIVRRRRGSPSSRAAPRSSRCSPRSPAGPSIFWPGFSASAVWRAQSIQPSPWKMRVLFGRAAASVSRSSCGAAPIGRVAPTRERHDLDRPVERGAMHEGAVMGVGEQLGEIGRVERGEPVGRDLDADLEGLADEAHVERVGVDQLARQLHVGELRGEPLRASRRRSLPASLAAASSSFILRVTASNLV